MNILLLNQVILWHLDDPRVRQRFDDAVGYAGTAEINVNAAMHFLIRIQNDKLYLSDPCYWSLMMYLGFILICIS